MCRRTTYIGEAGASARAKALWQEGRHEQPLNLRENGIGDAGVLALAAALDGSLRKPQPDGYYDLAVDKRARAL